MLYILATLLGGHADRWRGSADARGVAGILLYCALFLIVLGITDILVMIAFCVAFRIGESFGYGSPWSAVIHNRLENYSGSEWWEVLWWKTDPVMGLIVRGFLWGLPALPLCFFEPTFSFITISMMVAMPLSAVLISKYPMYWWPWWIDTGDKVMWNKAEYLRGWISVGICSLLVVL